MFIHTHSPILWDLLKTEPIPSTHCCVNEPGGMCIRSEILYEKFYHLIHILGHEREQDWHTPWEEPKQSMTGFNGKNGKCYKAIILLHSARRVQAYYSCAFLCLFLQVNSVRTGMGKQCIVPVSCPMPAALTPGISPSLPVPMPGTMLSGTINPFVMPLCPYGGLFPTPVFGMQWSGLTAQPGIVGGQSVARFPALDKTGLQLFPGPLQHPVVSPPGPT